MNVCYESVLQTVLLTVQIVALAIAIAIAVKNTRNLDKRTERTLNDIGKQIEEREAKQAIIGQQIQQTKEQLDSLVERMRNAGYYD